MNRNGVITIAVLLGILLLVFLYYIQVREKNQEQALSDSSASLALSGNAKYKDINGDPIHLSDYVGQTIVASAWATWCPSCVKQLQDLGQFSTSHPNVVVLAFNRAESLPTAVSYLEAFNIDPDVQLVMDSEDHFFTSVTGYAMPETVIFNSRGEIIHHERRALDASELSTLIESVK